MGGIHTCVMLPWTLHLTDVHVYICSGHYIHEQNPLQNYIFRRGEERGENDERMRLCPALITENEQL